MSLDWNYGEALHRMQVGDSFFIPTLDASTLIQRIKDAAVKEGIPVVCRRAITADVIGVRTWRVEPEAIDTSDDECDSAPQNDLSPRSSPSL